MQSAPECERSPEKLIRLLPRAAKISPDALMCPGCGRVNSVKIAGVYEYPRSPEKWYCRCDCGKSFNPKVKAKEVEGMLVQEQVGDMPGKIPLEPLDAGGYSTGEAGEQSPGVITREPDPGQAPKDDQEVTRRKTRLEIAREKLSLDEYLRLKEEGKTDNNIKISYKIASDTFTLLKREWGLPVGVLLNSQNKETGPAYPKTTSPRPAGLTIIQAMDLRDELTQDVDDFDHVLASVEKQVSERVVQAITYQRDIYKRALDRIDEVFNKTVVQL